MTRTIVLASIALAALSSTALAHFRLDEPAASLVQGQPYGDPQKVAPCGGVGTATNAVTNYQPGQMITIKLAETVSHPGHYRVSLAQTEGQLPPEPVVTAGATECGSAPINANPTLPVLADGLLVNLVPGDGQQSVQVQLPPGQTCNNCVLQVLEFMSSHSAPCFYHHCAIVNVSATAPDAGPVGTGPDAGAVTSPGSGGGGCNTARDSHGASSLIGMLGVVMLVGCGRRWRAAARGRG